MYFKAVLISRLLVLGPTPYKEGFFKPFLSEEDRNTGLPATYPAYGLIPEFLKGSIHPFHNFLPDTGFYQCPQMK